MTEEIRMDVNENSQPGNSTGPPEPVASTSKSLKPMDVDDSSKPAENQAMSKNARKKARKKAQQTASANKSTEETADKHEPDAQPNGNANNNTDDNSNNNSSGNTNNVDPKNGKGKKDRKKKEKNKQPKPKLVDCPDKILEIVLSQSDCKVPNLSAKLDEIIATNDLMEQRGQKILSHRTHFQDTIPNISEQIIVMPFGFENAQVEVDPSAVTQLQCIYHKPNHTRGKGGQKRRRRGR